MGSSSHIIVGRPKVRLPEEPLHIWWRSRCFKGFETRSYRHVRYCGATHSRRPQIIEDICHRISKGHWVDPEQAHINLVNRSTPCKARVQKPKAQTKALGCLFLMTTTSTPCKAFYKAPTKLVFRMPGYSKSRY